MKGRRLSYLSAQTTIIVLLLIFGSVRFGLAQVNVTTWHNDIGRTGQKPAQPSV